MAQKSDCHPDAEHSEGKELAPPIIVILSEAKDLALAFSGHARSNVGTKIPQQNWI
jgi:hypothetical protein